MDLFDTQWLASLIVTRGGCSWFVSLVRANKSSKDPRSMVETRSGINTDDSNDKSADVKSGDSDSSIVDVMDAKDESSRMSPLTRDNYARWIIEIEDALRGKSLWSHVDGRTAVVEVPATGASAADKKSYNEWDAKDSKARSIIRRTLDETTFSHVRDCKTAKEVIDRIRELREPKTTDVLMSSLTDFFSLQWSQTDDVTSFMASLSVLASKINTIKANMVPDELVIAKTLTSLPQDYGAFVQSWYLIAKDEPKLTDFRERLLTAERGLKKEIAWIGGGDALAARNTNRGNGRVTRTNSNIVCYRCNGKGHIARNCREQLPEGIEEAKVAQATRGDPLFCSLTAVSNEAGLIIADSGADRHLTSRREWFKSLRKLRKPLIFKTSGKSNIVVTHVGEIEIDASVDGRTWRRMMWKDVFYGSDVGSITLLSTLHLAGKGFEFSHGKDTMRLSRGGQTIIGGRRQVSTFVPFIRPIVQATDVVAPSKETRASPEEVSMAPCRSSEEAVKIVPVKSYAAVVSSRSSADKSVKRMEIDKPSGSSNNQCHFVSLKKSVYPVNRERCQVPTYQARGGVKDSASYVYCNRANVKHAPSFTQTRVDGYKYRPYS